MSEIIPDTRDVTAEVLPTSHMDQLTGDTQRALKDNIELAPHLYDAHNSQESKKSTECMHEIDISCSESDSVSDHLSDQESYGDLDLMESIIAELEAGEYMCLICAGDITARSEIWNCDSCFRVYHLQCTSAWADKSLKKIKTTSNTPEPETDEAKQGWPCPSCMTIVQKVPTEYKCWCRKTGDPKYIGLIPHSCAQTCAQTLKCGHTCTAICHPGPHPECCAMGPGIKCFCGFKEVQVPCVMAPYDGWSCGTVCNELLPCGKHHCKRKCHKGLCYDCTVEVSCKCYCGATVKDMTCGDSNPLPTCRRDQHSGKIMKWKGMFACDIKATTYYSCKIHTFERSCEPILPEKFKCPWTPKDSDTCGCGSTLVLDLLGYPRRDCTVPIPSCGSQCNKQLACGHNCPFTCHLGPCLTCPRVSEMQCRCGFHRYSVPCSMKVNGLGPQCTRRCTAKLNCKRHRCPEVCCPHEMASRGQRNNSISKQQTTVTTSEVHICSRVCGQLKSCKQHACELPCHSGPCPPCLESSDEDLVCPCGLTVVPAPVRCGTILPKCSHPCTKTRDCGHPVAEHLCHSDFEECPKW